MHVTRRSFIKSVALGGFAGVLMARPGRTLARAAAGVRTRPVLALVSGVAERSAFLQGIAETVPGEFLQVQRADHGMGFVRDFNQLLRSGQPTRIIGLVDDASAALIVELARASGARVPWLGYHAASSGHSRHRLLSTESTRGCAIRLGRQLSAYGAGFSLSEQRPHHAETSFELAARPRNGAAGDSDRWAAALGFILAAPDTAQSAWAPPATGTRPPLAGNFVSFAIET
jgi:hypothetical protein